MGNCIHFLFSQNLRSISEKQTKKRKKPKQNKKQNCMSNDEEHDQQQQTLKFDSETKFQGE